MKYRVIEKHRVFYPQRKVGSLWVPFLEPCNISTHGYDVVSRETLTDAEAFITDCDVRRHIEHRFALAEDAEVKLVSEAVGL